MPQPSQVRMLRRRMKQYGYTHISIIEIRHDKSAGRCYRITAHEPLSGAVVTADYDLVSIPRLMRRSVKGVKI